MSHHKTVCRPQVRKLVLKRLSRHLIDQGTFSVNHLVVREDENEIFTVGVNHAEGQLIVVVAPEIWILLHIAQKIVHPAHVPFIIKAKTAVLHVTGNLRPCRRFLGNQNRAVLASSEDRVQML